MAQTVGNLPSFLIFCLPGTPDSLLKEAKQRFPKAPIRHAGQPVKPGLPSMAAATTVGRHIRQVHCCRKSST